MHGFSRVPPCILTANNQIRMFRACSESQLYVLISTVRSDGAICHNPSTYLHVCRITLQQKNVLISAVFFEVNDALNCFGYREAEVLVTALFDLL